MLVTKKKKKNQHNTEYIKKHRILLPTKVGSLYSCGICLSILFCLPVSVYIFIKMSSLYLFFYNLLFHLTVYCREISMFINIGLSHFS